jgi:hypothetical protein
MALLLLALSLQGCAAIGIGLGVAAGVGAYTYVQGELKADYSYPLNKTWDASLAAMKKLQINITEQQKDAYSGKIVGTGPDGKKVTIKLENKGPTVTSVGVRVGTFGDQDASQKIHQTILRILKG